MLVIITRLHAEPLDAHKEPSRSVRCLFAPPWSRYMQGRDLVTFYSGPYDGDNSVRQAQTGKLI
jgi:hypothetical protein